MTDYDDVWCDLTGTKPFTELKVPDNFLRQGVNKEFQRVKFPLLPPNHYKFSINLSSH